VWDALFAEGSKILFRTALAVLKAQEEALLAFDNAGEHACVALGAGHPLIEAHASMHATQLQDKAEKRCAVCCCCLPLPGELLMAVRHYTSNLHDRDGLMNMAFEGIGSMPMAVIERCREERRWARLCGLCALREVCHWRRKAC
jgi:hypothetical protein